MKHSLSLALLYFLLAGCNPSGTHISSSITAAVQAGETSPIDLAAALTSQWDRFCVLTPYTNNERAAQTLGFKWDAESKTSIASNDGINVLVFIHRNAVVEFAEHPRNRGDFSQMKPSCLGRKDAKLIRKFGSDGWLYLVTQNDA